MNPYILLVDDDIDDLILLRDALSTAGTNYDVKEAEDGRQALNLLHSAKHKLLPSLIVLDINMPVLNGRELLAILKSDDELKDIPVLFFTTSKNPADEKYAAQYNVPLLIKPSNLILLSKAAQHMLEFCSA